MAKFCSAEGSQYFYRKYFFYFAGDPKQSIYRFRGGEAAQSTKNAKAFHDKCENSDSASFRLS
ncbi:UvrD-helicase domain-containing protein [Chryseobacterium indoltheticum]|uniref:UvrD-helicase domain-containing protein n=1 Tax=Chryseobacterium indoltheticum TaxID=254 RepID=UPI003F4905B2